jgi:hypothetical protein
MLLLHFFAVYFKLLLTTTVAFSRLLSCNNTVAAAENGIDLAKNGAAAKDGWQ